MFIDTCAVHTLVEELKLSHYDYLYFFSFESETSNAFLKQDFREQLQNTPQLIYMSLNKNSVYCVMPRSSKPPDTCKWGGPKLRGILKFSRFPDISPQMSAYLSFSVDRNRKRKQQTFPNQGNVKICLIKLFRDKTLQDLRILFMIIS